jgi:hypothetical protein
MLISTEALPCWAQWAPRLQLVNTARRAHLFGRCRTQGGEAPRTTAAASEPINGRPWSEEVLFVAAAGLTTLYNDRRWPIMPAGRIPETLGRAAQCVTGGSLAFSCSGLRQSLVTVGKPGQGGHRHYGAGSLRQLLQILSPGAQLSGGPGASVCPVPILMFPSNAALPTTLGCNKSNLG